MIGLRRPRPFLAGSSALKPIIAAAMLAALAPSARAACKQSFTTLGPPLRSRIQYRTAMTYKGLGQFTAAKRIATRLKAEGYSSVKRSSGVVTARQETFGLSRPQELHFIIMEKSGKTTIVAIFAIQQSQVAGNRVARNKL